MQRGLDFARGGSAPGNVIRLRRSLASRAAALLRPLGVAPRAVAPDPLPLTNAERDHYDASDFVLDGQGAETFRGLSRADSIEYISLHRIGLDNDDEAFLRLVRLGDRHAATMRLLDRR